MLLFPDNLSVNSVMKCDGMVFFPDYLSVNFVM